MNTKQVTLACCVFAATVAFGADWFYANGLITDGVWTFGVAGTSGTKVHVGYSSSGPSVVTALDFSKPVTNAAGTVYSIGDLNPRLGGNNGNNIRQYVGELTLPASGCTTISYQAFHGCANATGTISLPSDLTTLGGRTFYNCTKLTIVGSSFPEGVKSISEYEFAGCRIKGDLQLTYVTDLKGGEAFAGTDVGSVTFGPDLTTITNFASSTTKGQFRGCTSLTNVVFDPDSSVSIYNGNLFSGCTALTEIDLSAVVHIEQTENNTAHFNGCTALKKVTFGSKLNYLDGRIFNGASTLSKVVFKGPPPATIANTYLYGIGEREVTTYVILDKNAADYATAKAAWDALTAGGEINDMDSTWKADLVGGVSLANRPLLLYSVSHVSLESAKDADEGQGVIGSFVVSRGASDSTAVDLIVDYAVGGTAVPGQTYGELSGSVTIPAGSTSATIEIVPLDDPVTTSNTTVVVTLSSGDDYEIAASHGTATVNVVNGASFGGWTYTITGNNAGTMTNGDWAFNATHSGRELTVGAVTAYPADVSPLDFSTCVAGSDGAGYTIVNLNITQLGAANESAATPESGSRVGLLTLPGEGLTTIRDWAFMNCTNAYGSLVFPSTLTKIGGGAFGKTKVSGDLTFPSLERMNAATFWKTKITSVTFGPAFTGLWGGWERGPFYGCASLTNVVFDPASKITLGFQGFIFCHCTSLTDLDLSCVTNIAYENCGANFRGCSALTNITFGAGLTELPTEAFSGATALETLYFKGAAPVIVGDGGLFTGVGAAQTITTYVSVKFADVKNSANFSWNDYVEGGVLGKSSTYWKSEYLFSGAKTSNFPLLRFDSNALMIVVR